MCAPKKTVLFVCTHNAIRSQMAEALLNEIYGDRYSAYSAGSDPTQIDPLVKTVMNEIDIDVSNHHSKGFGIFKEVPLDDVITLCDQAKESCPYFPGGKLLLHRSFPDPSDFKGNHEETMNRYRQIRDEIKDWIEKEFG